MHFSIDDATTRLAEILAAAGIDHPAKVASSATWLEACGYPGLQLLAEALADERRSLPLHRDLIGLDLQNVSCAFLAYPIVEDVKANGRVFLRNVRHGLFLVPYTVEENLAIGCPVDPSFAVGGQRHKNPYGEKLAQAAGRGLDIEESVWTAINEARPLR